LELEELGVSLQYGFMDLAWLEDEPSSNDIESVSILALSIEYGYLQRSLDLFTFLD